MNPATQTLLIFAKFESISFRQVDALLQLPRMILLSYVAQLLLPTSTKAGLIVCNGYCPPHFYVLWKCNFASTEIWLRKLSTFGGFLLWTRGLWLSQFKIKATGEGGTQSRRWTRTTRTTRTRKNRKNQKNRKKKKNNNNNNEINNNNKNENFTRTRTRTTRTENNKNFKLQIQFASWQ